MGPWQETRRPDARRTVLYALTTLRLGVDLLRESGGDATAGDRDVCALLAVLRRATEHLAAATRALVEAGPVSH